MNYSIIILARNEAHGIRDTLISVANQTITPTVCTAIDDESTDNTANIIKEFESKFSFIKYLKNTSNNTISYSLGGHVVDLFNLGVKKLVNMGISSDFIVKMDADIAFEAEFIEKIFRKIDTLEDIGIVSGTPFYIENDRIKYEYSHDWHTNGQFKIYNRKCLEDIGGLKRSLGWDTADNVVAISRGWKTLVYRDITYKMFRKVGGKFSLVKGKINQGIGCYLLGYNFLYFVIKIIHNIFKVPYFIGSWYLFYGYCEAVINRYDKILSKEQTLKLRKLLWKSFFKKFKNRD